MVERSNLAAPRVSVVIPAYNADQTLADTLDSLCAQSFTGWEGIVVDDGSMDSTAEVAASYIDRDGRIRLIRQSQRGEGAARNTGIRSANGEWLLFLDSDDWLADVALERLLSTADFDESADCVLCRTVRVTHVLPFTPMWSPRSSARRMSRRCSSSRVPLRSATCMRPERS